MIMQYMIELTTQEILHLCIQKVADLSFTLSNTYVGDTGLRGPVGGAGIPGIKGSKGNQGDKIS